MLNNKSYDVLKWLTMIALPAISVFIKTVGTEIGISDPETVVLILNASTVLLGSLIGVSTLQYNSKQTEKNKVEEDIDGE